MTARRTNQMNSDMELKIAVCVSTYYRMNGVLPGYVELCSMVGEEMSSAVADYMIGHGYSRPRVQSA